MLCFVSTENHFAKAQVIFHTEQTSSPALPEKSLSESAMHEWCVLKCNLHLHEFLQTSATVSSRSAWDSWEYFQESLRIAFIQLNGRFDVRSCSRICPFWSQPPVPNCQWMATMERDLGDFLVSLVYICSKITSFYLWSWFKTPSSMHWNPSLS